MKIFINKKGRVFENVQPQIACMGLSAKLEVMIAYQLMIDLYFDYLLFDLTHGNLYLTVVLYYKKHYFQILC